MPDAPAAPAPHTVNVTDAGPCLKKISIRIPASTVRGKLDSAVASLAEGVRIPGFRPGRAPAALIEKRGGSALREEAKKELARTAISEAVKEHKLRVVGDVISPDFNAAQIKDGEDLTFEIDIEVVPEFTVPAWEGLEILRPIIPVTDEMVKAEIDKACINEGELESRTEPEHGDYITGHAIMKGPDGKEFYNLNGAVVQVPTADRAGKGMILGVMVEDFEKQLGRPKAGETATVRVTGPENHEVEAIRNTPLTVTFKVERIDRIIPAKPEDVAKRFGYENVDQVREMVRTRLAQRVLIDQQTAMRQQVAVRLLRATAMDLPRRLTAGQAARLLERNRMDLMYRGIDPQKIEERMAELRSVSTGTAAAELKLFFILSTIADNLKIGVTEAELNGLVAQMARERNQRPEQIRQELIQSGRVNNLAQQLREYKTLDAIIAKARVTEKSREEFDAAMKEFEREQGAAKPEPAAPAPETPAEGESRKSEPKKSAPKKKG